MRLVAFLSAAILAGVGANGALAANGPKDGFVVFKDMKGYAVTEVRDAATGRIVSSEVELGEAGAESECGDSRHTFVGKWKGFEPYLFDIGSTPAGLSPEEVQADLHAAAVAWQSPFATLCDTNRTSPYRVSDAGTTTLGASLAGLVSDDANVVEFRPLAGTPCDGALACTILNFKGSTITEADIIIESDLGRHFQDSWTTGDTTDYEKAHTIAVIDVATHEFGHFAGLGHTKNSPALTMYPYIQDGAQTLGLGDLKGLAARYQ